MQACQKTEVNDTINEDIPDCSPNGMPWKDGHCCTDLAADSRPQNSAKWLLYRSWQLVRSPILEDRASLTGPSCNTGRNVHQRVKILGKVNFENPAKG